MSPMITRGGTVRHSVRIKAKETEIASPQERQSPKNAYPMRKRPSRKTKQIQVVQDEQDVTAQEPAQEEDNSQSKKLRTQKSRKKVATNRTNEVGFFSDKDDSCITSMSTNTRANALKLSCSQEDAMKLATPKKSKVTLTPERLLLVEADTKCTPTPRVTPKINPVAVNRTPHRASKTPKKSPVNPSSPKTHSKTPLRWSKTPRKLPITENSPVSSDKSSTPSIENATAQKEKRLSKNHSTDAITPVLSSRLKKKQTSTSVKSVQSVRRFSKSPKIVLRPPRSKSRKSKSPKAIRRTSKASPGKKSPRQKQTTALSPSTGNSVIVEGKSPSAMLKDLSPLQRTAVLNQPRVVLEKLKFVNDAASASKNKWPLINEQESDETIVTPLVQIPTHEIASPKRPPRSTAKKRLPVTSETPLRPRSSPRTLSLKRDVNNESVGLKESSLAENLSLRIYAPEMSSTPHDKLRRPVNLNASFDLNESPRIPSSPVMTRSRNEISPKSCKKKCDDSDKTASCIVDVSESSMKASDASASESANKNSTYEIGDDNGSADGQNGATIDNDTYEVLEPKTPILQKRSKKRSSTAADFSLDHSQAKRVCKVRFASPVPEAGDGVKKSSLQITHVRSSTPNKQTTQKKSGVTDNTAAKPYTENTLNNNGTCTPPSITFRKRSSSISDVRGQRLVSAVLQKNQRSTSLSRVGGVKLSSARKQQETPRNKSFNKNHSISSQTKAVRTPVARKVPNFAHIHQKQFADMESVVDAKNRLERRHVAMTSTKTKSKPVLENKKQVLPGETVNGVYNRFGYKLKKEDARDIVSKKQPAAVKKNKKEDNRSIIKGVRMNRRFELQMKSRNINL